jgi:predicted nucleic acid-binding protein
MAGPTVSLLLDNSAWARIVRGVVPDPRGSEIRERFAAGEVAVASPFLLEAGFSARAAAEHSALFERLLVLPFLGIDEQAERRALAAQSQLARAGHHRLPPTDLMIAAIAERHGVGVLHYDADYDLIRERTDLRFESVWLAEQGTL